MDMLYIKWSHMCCKYILRYFINEFSVPGVSALICFIIISDYFNILYNLCFMAHDWF